MHGFTVSNAPYTKLTDWYKETAVWKGK